MNRHNTLINNPVEYQEDDMQRRIDEARAAAEIEMECFVCEAGKVHFEHNGQQFAFSVNQFLLICDLFERVRDDLEQQIEDMTADSIGFDTNHTDDWTELLSIEK